MQSALQSKHNRIEKHAGLVWLTAALLVILVVATISVVGSCLYSYVHQSDCQISLYDGRMAKSVSRFSNAASQKNTQTDPIVKSLAVQYSGPEAKAQSEKGAFKVNDADQVWKTETAIELFQAEYKNADGVVTVKSADGSKVIAPGTEGSYTFSLKNTGNVSADYKVWVESSVSSKVTGVPLRMRMSDGHGWLLGGKNSWESAEDLDGVSTTENINAGRSTEYTIYWQWPFEQNSDAADTGLGDTTVNQELSYTVTIYTLAATATNSAADGEDQSVANPAAQILEAVKTGDYTQILLWVVLLIVAAGILIWQLMRNRRGTK